MNAPVNPNKALWEKGDFTGIAATMRESGEALVQTLGSTKGLKVLDLGCGDGTTALPAAKLGADVLGVDVATNLVDAGNRRAAEQGLTNLKFQEGDASNLEQVPDKAFDLVVSIFGAMFAPKPFEVAKEIVRVTRPGRPLAFLDAFRKYYGPTMNAFEAAERKGRAAELQKELEELFNSQNKSQDATSIPATFLRVTVAVESEK